MKTDSYFPVVWSDFGSNGLNGEPVEETDAIIVYDSDEESPTFECVLHETSVSELIDDFIDGIVEISSNKVKEPEMIIVCKDLKEKLYAAISKIDNALV